MNQPCKLSWLFSVRTKFAALTSMPVALISVFIYCYLPRELEVKAKAAMAERTQSLSVMLACNISLALQKDDRQLVRAGVMSAQKDPDLQYIMVRNAAGDVIADYNGDQAIALNYTEAGSTARISNDGSTVQCSQPIQGHTHPLGHVYVGLSLDSMRQEVAQSRSTIASVSGVIGVLGILCAIFLSTVIAKPLMRIARTAERLSQRDWKQRVPIESRDEVGQLAAAFNTMVDTLGRAYDELLVEKTRFEQLFENAPLGILLADDNERIIHANSVFQKMFGYSLSELRGRTINETIVPPHLAREGNELSHRVLMGEPIQAESVRVSKDGRALNVNIYGVPIRMNDRAIGVFGLYVDITEKKRAELERARLVHALRSASECIIITDVEDRIVYVNDAFQKMYGYAEHEMIGKPVTVLRAPSHKDVPVRDKTLQGGWQGELMNRRKDGTEFPIFLSTSVVRDEEGRIIGLVGVSTDITEKKQAEEQRARLLRQLEAMNKELNDFFEDDLAGAFIATPDGKLLACNPSFARIFGFGSVEEALRCNLLALYPRSRKFAEVRDLVRLNKRLEHYEVQLRRSDGSAVHIIQNVIGRFDERGELAQIKGYVFDNTRHKLLEEQLRQAQKMESIGTLAGGIAHDFNNILAIIMGHAHILMKGDPALIEQAKSVETIHRAVQRGSRLVNQILTFARRNEVVFEPVNLNHLIEELHKMLVEMFPRKIDFVLKLDPALPITIADANQVHQALLNLCINARDAMPNGGTLTIESKLVRGMFLRERHPEAHEHLYACIRVADTGTGMPPEILSRMFEPFFTTKEIGKGTGLGLAVVYGVTKSHKGFVDVESQVEQGTCFTMYFPIRRQEMEMEIPSMKKASDHQSASGTILVVEDEEMLLELVRDLLAGRGYTVLTATNGLEALDIYARKQNEIDLVLADLGLPKMDGWEAFQRMREINPDVKVVFASGYIDQTLRENLLGAGAMDLVQKPYMPDEIVNRVREHLLCRTEAASP